MSFDLDNLLKKILAKDRQALAKSITLMESLNQTDKENAEKLIAALPRFQGKRIAFSGTPGVGKSTLLNYFADHISKRDEKVAILTIDPSSIRSGGSILGDKTRMPDLVNNTNVFIRPSPSLGQMGGVSSMTYETVLLCEAAGFSTIIIETVGVGQSEVQVADLVDFFVLLMQPGSGDELQGIKKGILEIADLIVVNKSDGELENLAKITAAQLMATTNSSSGRYHFWSPKVLRVSALKKMGLQEIYQEVLNFYKDFQKDQQYYRQEKIINLLKYRSLEILRGKLNSTDMQSEISKKALSIFEQKISLEAAAQYLSRMVHKH